MHGILRWTMAPVMRGWAANLERKFAGVPQPLDAPQVHSPGRDSHRILIVGGGMAVGWGVLSHTLGLPGSLARALTARTGRGAGVDVTARSSMTVRTAHRHIDFDTLRRYDAVVLTLGIGDAGQLTSPRAWLHDLARLVERIQLSTAGGTEIYLAGIVALSSLPIFKTPLGALAGAQAQALNRASIAYCAQQNGISYVRLPATVASTSGRFRSATDYEVWADSLAAQMVAALPRASGSAGERDDAALPTRTAEETEAARHRALLTLNLLDTAPEERFDRIVALASSTLGTSAAAFTVLDGDRQWHKSVVGLQVTEIPRSSSFCTVTVLEPAALIVPDALLDDRFRDSPLVVAGPRLRFYAGFPIESPTGERIGALCVYDEQPRSVDSVDVVLLRELALVLQNELWRPVDGAGTDPGSSVPGSTVPGSTVPGSTVPGSAAADGAASPL
ncbi:GAF domain-containing protein [Cryobacterium sp. AP23]